MIFFKDEIDKAAQTFEEMFKEVGWRITYDQEVSGVGLLFKRTKIYKRPIKDFLIDLVKDLETHYPKAISVASYKFEALETSKGTVIRLRPEVEAEYTELKRKNAKNKMQNGV